MAENKKKPVKNTVKKPVKVQQDPTVLNSEYKFGGGGGHGSKD